MQRPTQLGEGHLSIETPERVSVALDVAGLGTRILAYLIDALVLFLLWMTGGFVLSLIRSQGVSFDDFRALASAVQAALIFGAFFLQWGYWVAFESLWGGRSPGKRALGIRVVRLDGSPETFGDAALRNLVRTADFLPVLYAVGLVTMLANSRSRRLGDLLAGTVVVRERRIDLDRYAAAEGEGLSLSAEEAELVSAFVARAPGLEPAARARVALRIAGPLAARLPEARRAQVLASPEAAERFLAQGMAAQGGLAGFVRQRRPSWEELAALIARLERGNLPLADLQKVDRLYRRAASDLARAAAQFPGSDVHAYLNQLCAQGYASVYRRRPSRGAALRDFLLQDFPRAFLAELRFFWLALGLLLGGGLAGAAAALVEPSSVTPLVPDAVRDAVEQGVLWTDHALSASTPLVLGSYVVTNNLGVALAAFGLGMTAGLGTAFVLLFNGLHLGAVLALCFQGSLGPRLLGFMVAHGVVELFAILVAGQAGLVVGAALLAPGELSRADALRVRGRRALTLALGTLPLLLIVGMVEGFVSPGTLVPAWLKTAVGFSLGGLLVGYLLKYGRAAGSAGPAAGPGRAAP